MGPEFGQLFLNSPWLFLKVDKGLFHDTVILNNVKKLEAQMSKITDESQQRSPSSSFDQGSNLLSNKIKPVPHATSDTGQVSYESTCKSSAVSHMAYSCR